MVADRAYLAGGRIGPGLARLDRELGRIMRVLRSTGATTVEPAALQPAEVLLDLYGEDIRARAFVTRDEGAEMMLRPDFTVPIVRLHMDAGAEPARYVYSGPVWRRQDAGSTRPREYLQAGFEVFEGGDPAAHDAEVLGLVTEALGGAAVDLVTGDLGLVLAAIDALGTSAARKAALRRHVWRPVRFHALLRQFGEEHAALRARRAALLAAEAEGRVPELIAAGRQVGARGAEEVAARVAHLAEEAATPPLPAAEVARIEALLAVQGQAPAAVAELRALAAGVPQLAAAVDRLEARLAAFAARGIRPEALRFEASFGRTSLEYYDGMVFGAMPRGRDDLPPVASGGRYDTLTRVLGRGRGIPAVGGIIRPEALVALCG
ncbi:ATP phosphoribosyltransferase regulatory subunit [uncultured Amaricoccus sp.]|uniref:ATP phosphoribosyltransferase regulatory subunit n=2 Tax=Amaricoccus TaxID=56999 RepID=UPI00262422DD|nr:ATP phosphoribosyltransferase regulatory subunit [uncultured Amaricoccus sp.]